MPPTIVGVLGLKRSGKDTFASRLVAEHGFTRFAFADPMKDFALALDPLIVIDGDEAGLLDVPLGHYFANTRRLSALVQDLGWERAKELREVRRTLQRLGTEAGRGVFGEDFWVERTAALVAASGAERVVLTDVRFPNEAAWVRRVGGTAVRIVRPGQRNSDAHLSENALGTYRADVEIVNGATLEHLFESADTFAESFLNSAA